MQPFCSLMSEKSEYVLGTNDEELNRLGLQHRVWRPTALECWRRAGITFGSRVIDVGAGPGYATMDLAELVGPKGEVIAIERSERFLAFAQSTAKARNLTNIRFRQADLMEESLGILNVDAAWCRWVASFVSSPEKLVHEIAVALRPGGVAIFHEYIDYRTWRIAPRRLAMESFVNEVVASWRASGGEPDVVLNFPIFFRKSGLRILEANPRILTISPRDYAWQWPASFVEINLARLLELGRVDSAWVEEVRREFREAESDPMTLLNTPLFLEIIARRE